MKGPHWTAGTTLIALLLVVPLATVLRDAVAAPPPDPSPTPQIVYVEQPVYIVVTATPEPTAVPEPTAEPTLAPTAEPVALEPSNRGGRPLVGERWTDADVRLALADAPLMVQRIVYCEVGRSGTYNPYAVGSLGEIGPAQLLPGAGNGLSIFYHWGYQDPNSPYEARAFIEQVIDAGMLRGQYPRTSLGCAGSV